MRINKHNLNINDIVGCSPKNLVNTIHIPYFLPPLTKYDKILITKIYTIINFYCNKHKNVKIVYLGEEHIILEVWDRYDEMDLNELLLIYNDFLISDKNIIQLEWQTRSDANRENKLIKRYIKINKIKNIKEKSI